jgi:hypothetical protein
MEAAELFPGQKLKWIAAAVIVLALGIAGFVLYRVQQPAGKTVVRIPPSVPVAPAVLPTSLRGRFSDGTQIEVLGLTDPANPGKWWTLDGTATDRPNYQDDRSITMSYRTARRVDAIVRMSGVDLSHKSLTVASDEKSRGAKSSSGTDEEKIWKIILPVPLTANTGNLRFGLSSGPWTEILNVSAGEQPTTQSSGHEVELGSISEDKGRTLVKLNYPKMDQTVPEDREVIAVANGSEIRPFGASVSGTQSTYYFGSPMSDITHVIVRRRAYEWIQYKNVAFWPQTAPRSVVVANPGQSTSVAP